MQLGILLFTIFGREPRLPIDVKYLARVADDWGTSVLDHRKRVVEKVELAQNLARENLQPAQQKMKDYYDQKIKEPVFEVGQRIKFGFILREVEKGYLKI